MKNPVMIFNVAEEDRGQLKAALLCDRLVWMGIAHCYEKVGVCHTVTVEEGDVGRALDGVSPEFTRGDAR
jgi:hypothetical protein